MIPGKVVLVYKGSLIAAMQLFKRVVASAAVKAFALGLVVNVLSKKRIMAILVLRILTIGALLHLAM
jgi:hypothetical protein